jgi:hypothetical protein
VQAAHSCEVSTLTPACSHDVTAAAGATGGFAGGEAGLKQYVETGELKLRDPNQPTPKQTSPVAVAGLLVAAGAGGGLLLTELTDLGENAIKGKLLEVRNSNKSFLGRPCTLNLCGRCGHCVWVKKLADIIPSMFPVHTVKVCCLLDHVHFPCLVLRHCC